ncbi:PKD-like family lipoprotein [Sphingobacterium tabacisoli]|uniref:PKD-like family lipoprotein n=1 Tax=Sphingobacterium tabacisoli TaxID=2044855 RepID=A0ABW5L5T8_9SPHI|nr:PKD-like family lipoprotein [Sphingobacterium tabacisoli]
MKLIIKHIIPICLLFLIIGCYKDKGNYDYTILDQIRIDTSQSNILAEYAIDRTDTLHIVPKIYYNGTLLDNSSTLADKVSLTWSIYQNFASTNIYTVDTLGHTIGLKAAMLKPAGNWVVKLTVRDLKNQTETYQKFAVTINETISDGWMVLYEREGNSDVGLIVDSRVKNNIVKERLFIDLIKNSNGSPLLGSPVTILHPTSNLTRGGDLIVASKHDLVGINKSNFEISYPFNKLFWTIPKNRNLIGYTTNGSKEFALHDNSLHNINFAVTTSNRNNTTLSPAIGNAGIQLAPWQPKKYLAALDGLVFDSAAKRFLKLTSGAISFTTFSNQPSTPYSLDNIDLDYVMADWGYGNGTPALAHEYLVMKNNNQNYYLLRANFNSAVDNTIPVSKLDISHNPDIQNINSLAVAYVGQYLLYGARDKVYRQYFSTNQVAEPLWTAPTGEVVTSVALQKFFFPSFHLANILPNGNQVVYFATWNESTKNGKVYSYKIDQINGNLDLSSQKVYEGFGRIKEMSYKWNI